MKKLLLVLCSIGVVAPLLAFADNSSESTVANSPSPTPSVPPPNNNASFINRSAYLQNPYNSENYPTTGGGTLVVNESQVAQQNFWQKWFEDGTYNVYAGTTVNAAGTANSGNNPAPYNRSVQPYSYGANIFAQTGQAAGFSIGGLFSTMNPLFAAQEDGLATQQGSKDYSIYNTTYSQAMISEAFVEYQYKNTVQADVGYIGINNSPWINGNYENNLLTVPATYQGALVNIYPGGGWLLTALAFNAAQYGAAPGFTGNTNYSITQNGISVSNGYAASNGTVALGANYSGLSNNYNLRLWGYQFDNYGTLLYSDTSLTLPVNDKSSFNISAQAGTDQQWFQANNAITQYNGTIIQSYMAGIRGNWTYDWFQLNLSANTMWGAANGYNGGAFVSPYTVGQSVDPTYSNGWSTNMISNGFTGSEYKLSTQFGFLNNNLTISPAYIMATSGNVQYNGIQEADLLLNYSIPQVRGLYLFGVYANQWLPAQNPNGTNAWTSEVGVFYAY